MGFRHCLLKKINALINTININKLLIGAWKVSTNKKIDALYFVKSDTCITRGCHDFYRKYLQHTDNDSTPFRPNDLPEGVLGKWITINFSPDGMFKAEKIVVYGNKNGSDSPTRDTRNTIGKWLVDKEFNIQLQSDFEELNGKFNFNELEYDEFLEFNRK